MARGTFASRLTVAMLSVAEAATVVMALALFPMPADAQLFDERFPFQNRRVQPRGPFDWFFAPQQNEERPQPVQPPQDYSRAPTAKKPEPKPDTAAGATLNTVMVFGDSMADWLAYGLELAYADSPEMAVLRRHRTNSGLIRTEARSDPREYPDWPQAAREMIATGKPKFVLMMIGMNDRRQIRETAQAARPARPAAARPDDPASLELDKPASDKPSSEKPADSAAAEPPAPTGNRTLEFRTDAWSEAYIRRIDDMVATLKTSAVPVFWVGLPSLRGQKAASDISFLNDLYRSRADKAGIIYIDIWDGFVDEDGRFAQSGPDYEGQIRRLRSGDGVHFTQAGARKLAHYVEREIQRWLNARGTQAALPIPDEVETPAPAAPGGAAGRRARPLAGPTVQLMGNVANESDDQLLGGNAKAPAGDALVAKVLVNGEAMRVPAGRADDFTWPRRDIAPVGSDPVVATTDLPMTPMVAEKSRSSPSTPAAATTAVASAAPAAPPRPRRVAPPRPTYAENQNYYRPDVYQRPQTYFPFQSLFGGRW